MIYLNVIDLDNTLISFDSFRAYVKYCITKKANFQVLFLTFARVLRIISAETFKRHIIQINVLNDDELGVFVNQLSISINEEIVKIISFYSSKETLNVICSASPNSYVSKLANQIGMTGHGSIIQSNNVFYHMFGENKRKFIANKYPQERYIYNMAISDSKSDLPLLQMFKCQIFVGN